MEVRPEVQRCGEITPKDNMESIEETQHQARAYGEHGRVGDRVQLWEQGQMGYIRCTTKLIPTLSE